MATVILIELQHAYLLAGFVALITAGGLFMLRGMEQNQPRVMPLFVTALVLVGLSSATTVFGATDSPGSAQAMIIGVLDSFLVTTALIISVEVGLRLFCQQSRLRLMLSAIGVTAALLVLVTLLGGGDRERALTSELVTMVVMVAGVWWLMSTDNSISPYFKRLSTLIAGAFAVASLASIYLIFAGYWMNSATAVQMTPAIALMLMAKLLLPAAFTAVLLLEINTQNVMALRRRVDTDSLTNLTSRGSLNERGESLIERTRLSGKLVAVLMLDIDYFKRVNDEHGHEVGDFVLEHCAHVLRKNLRPEAVIARYGGEEFCAIVPINNERDSWVVAERLRKSVQGSPYRQQRRTGAGGEVRQEALTLPITISVGGTIARQGEQLDALLAAADRELYKAKRAGRNRVSLTTHNQTSDTEPLFVV